jgi:hypothetical protein
LRSVPSSDCKAGGVVTNANADADADAAAPALLLLPFAFVVVPMDGLSQFHGKFFGRTASLSSIVAVDHDNDAGVG